ncbi:MAG: phosphoribosylglycinamide formyltransferase [Flavobacteriales bacterium]|nr:phosphoribosylglycinamide formyltransferase [Flavobacteriales bacterium]|tara:strand:- start:5723 stop:6301 length:579 start_codon:yes stop_codon:yes gene_type:complete
MYKNKIAILVSGLGTNAINIIQYFNKNNVANVALVISNKADALAVKKAQNMGVETIVFNNESFKKSGNVLACLKSNSIDFIVLAGFLVKIPNDIIQAYPKKIVNLHPSLLPKYGGKGMYGNHVHRAVIEAKESESGISIHFVNEEYDEGAIIFQAKVSVEKEDSVGMLAERIQQLEHCFFPKVIEQVISKSL